MVVWLRAVSLFYRSIAPFSVGITAVIIVGVLLPGLQEGWVNGRVPLLILIKLMTGPVVWYLAEQTRPDQYWLYYNLGISRGRLWTGVAVVDTLLFWVLVVLAMRMK